MHKFILLTICILFAFNSCSKTQRTTTNTSDVNTTEAITECTPTTQEECIQTLTHAVVADNREAVAEMVEYPFPQPYPLKPILNEQEFIQLYDRIISPDLCKELQNSTAEDWNQKSWRGVYFKNGEIWIRDNPNKEEHKLRFYSFIQIAYKGRCTYLGDDYGMEKHLAEIHERNKSKFTDQEILDCLREAHTEYKLPMIELLKKYYMIKYNADTKVDVNILEALGFKHCSACCAISNSSIES